MTEILTIFNGNHQKIGTASRQKVHRVGLWHETFHCWLYRYYDGQLQVLLQHRSGKKADFANQLDITAAGHLLADESIADGVREIQEELGLTIAFTDLISLGCFPVTYEIEDFIDREFCHIFALEVATEMPEFELQETEVQGLYYCNLSDLERLLKNQTVQLELSGLKRGETGNVATCLSVSKSDVCAHFLPYYDYLFRELPLKTQVK